jgi:predicted patatin/cPLA2 family phospholipase
MFRSSMRSSSGSSLFISLLMLLILKNVKIFKKYYQSIVVIWQRMFNMPVMRTVWRRALDWMLFVSIQHSVQHTSPHSTHYRHTKHMLPHNHDGLIIFFFFFLIIFNISNIDKEINKELPEDYLIEYRNMLECFLKCFKWF